LGSSYAMLHTIPPSTTNGLHLYYKPNEQYPHLIGLAHFMTMLKHLNNTFIILIMKYLHNNLKEKL
jgi:hypothetical protein